MYLFLFAFTFTVLICAAFYDLNQHRIPNWLTLTSIIMGLVFGYFSSGVEGLKLSAIGLAVGFVAFLIPFALGGTGGGDVKLMAAVGALVGWPLIVWAILLSCVVALFAAAAKAIWQGRFIKMLVNTWLIIKMTLIAVILKRPREEIKELTKEQGSLWVPFGASISVGTVWALVLQYLMTKGIISYLPYFRGF